MQGLADGYFVIPVHARRTTSARTPLEADVRPTTTPSRRPRPPCRRGIDRLLGGARASQTPRAAASRARPAPVGRRRHGAQRRPACARALARDSRSCATSSGRTSRCPATPNNLNKNLEYAGRVADYLEFAELLALDALDRDGVVRWALPRGEPDARRRGPARRRATSRYVVGVGVHRRRQGRRRCTRSRSSFEYVQADASGATSETSRCASTCASGGRPARHAPGRLVDLHRRGRLPRHVVPRDARRRQRGADHEGRGTDRVRLRLPRRHLRHVRLPRQRPPHGPDPGTTVCQLHMRRFKDGDTITLEPWRAARFPSSRIWSSIAARSIASSRPAATRR